jgi:hypothetical protein
MTHKGLHKYIVLASLGAAFCLACVYAGVAFFGLRIARDFPGETRRIALWLILGGITAAPCLAAVVFSLKIASLVRRDKSFSRQTSQLLKNISACSNIAALYFAAVNIVMFISGYQHPSTMLASAVLILLALSAGAAFAALSRFVAKAAELQEESDLTV